MIVCRQHVIMFERLQLTKTGPENLSFSFSATLFIYFLFVSLNLLSFFKSWFCVEGFGLNSLQIEITGSLDNGYIFRVPVFSAVLLPY